MQTFVKTQKLFFSDYGSKTTEDSVLFVVVIMNLQQDFDSIQRCDRCFRCHSSDTSGQKRFGHKYRIFQI